MKLDKLPLVPKLKLLRNDEFNHLSIILTKPKCQEWVNNKFYIDDLNYLHCDPFLKPLRR